MNQVQIEQSEKFKQQIRDMVPKLILEDYAYRLKIEKVEEMLQIVAYTFFVTRGNTYYPSSQGAYNFFKKWFVIEERKNGRFK